MDADARQSTSNIQYPGYTSARPTHPPIHPSARAIHPSVRATLTLSTLGEHLPWTSTAYLLEQQSELSLALAHPLGQAVRPFAHEEGNLSPADGLRGRDRVRQGPEGIESAKERINGGRQPPHVTRSVILPNPKEVEERKLEARDI